MIYIEITHYQFFTFLLPALLPDTQESLRNHLLIHILSFLFNPKQLPTPLLLFIFYLHLML